MRGEQPPLPINEPEGPAALNEEITVQPWVDPVVEAHGFGPRSMYVEVCWLPVLGPSATWAYRRLGSWVEFHPDGLQVNLKELSAGLGLGEGLGRHSLLAKSLGRLAHFGVAQGRATRWPCAGRWRLCPNTAPPN